MDADEFKRNYDTSGADTVRHRSQVDQRKNVEPPFGCHHDMEMHLLLMQQKREEHELKMKHLKMQHQLKMKMSLLSDLTRADRRPGYIKND